MLILIVIAALCIFTKYWYKDWKTTNTKTNRDHPNYRIIEIDQNIKNSPENLRRFAVKLQ